DYDTGEILIADLERPRLGIRWKKAKGKKFDPATLVRRALRDEVGELAAAEARELPAGGDKIVASLLYVDPKPPGRDVWTAFSMTSGRLIQIVYHSRKRERLLKEMILPTVSDCNPSAAMPWSIFEL